MCLQDYDNPIPEFTPEKFGYGQFRCELGDIGVIIYRDSKEECLRDAEKCYMDYLCAETLFQLEWPPVSTK